LTIASADVNGDTIDDLVVASRSSTDVFTGDPIPAKVVVYAGANSGAGGTLTGTTLGSLNPTGMGTNGIYVTAGDTNGDGKAEVAISSSSQSLVQIFSVSGGTFTQVGADLHPFGTDTFVAANGDGQIRALHVNGSATVDFE